MAENRIYFESLLPTVSNTTQPVLHQVGLSRPAVGKDGVSSVVILFEYFEIDSGFIYFCRYYVVLLRLRLSNVFL